MILKRNLWTISPYPCLALFLGGLVLGISLNIPKFTPVTTIGLLLCLVLILCLKNLWAYLFSLILFHFFLGQLIQEFESIKTNRRTYFYHLSEIKTYKNHGQMGVGTVLIRENKYWSRTNTKIKCQIFSSNRILKNGDIIASTEKPTKIINSNNPGSFDVKTYYTSKGIFQQTTLNHYIYLSHEETWLDKLANFRKQIEQKFSEHLKGEELALANALLLGDATALNNEVKQAYSATGSIHVLAVSGMHISLFAEIMLLSFGLFSSRISKRKSWVIGIFILWFYAFLTGLSPSVLRAVIMFTLAKGAHLTSRNPQSNVNLVACAIFMILWDPLCFWDMGFQLSFLAIFGIQNYQHRISRLWQPKYKISKFLWESTASALAAQLFTVPLTLYYFHTFPNYFLIANLGIAILSVAAMYCGFAYLFFCIIPGINQMLGWCLELILKFMNQFVKLIAEIPGSIEGGFHFNFLFVLFIWVYILWFFYEKKRPKFKLLTLTILISIGSLHRHKNLNTSHLMILKAKSPIVVLKTGPQAVFISAIDTNQQQIKNALSDYQKIYPLRYYKFLKIPMYQKVKMRKMSLLSEGKCWKIQIPGKSFKLHWQFSKNWMIEKAHLKFVPFNAAKRW